jgi:hypothetical protein
MWVVGWFGNICFDIVERDDFLLHSAAFPFRDRSWKSYASWLLAGSYMKQSACVLARALIRRGRCTSRAIGRAMFSHACGSLVNSGVARDGVVIFLCIALWSLGGDICVGHVDNVLFVLCCSIELQTCQIACRHLHPPLPTSH